MRGSHGTFYWNELCARDIGKAKKFYAETIGWSFEAMPMPGGGTYWVAKMADQPVAGGWSISPSTTSIAEPSGRLPPALRS